MLTTPKHYENKELNKLTFFLSKHKNKNIFSASPLTPLLKNYSFLNNKLKHKQQQQFSFKNKSISRNINLTQHQFLSHKSISNFGNYLFNEYNTKSHNDEISLPKIQSPRCVIEMTNPMELSFGMDCNIKNENEVQSNNQTENTCYTSQMVNVQTENEANNVNNKNDSLIYSNNYNQIYCKKRTYPPEIYRNRKCALLLRTKRTKSIKQIKKNNNDNSHGNSNNNELKYKSFPKYPNVKYSSQQIGNCIKCYAVNSYQGRAQTTNEDKVSIILQISNSKNTFSHSYSNISFFAIYDGYNGTHKSNYLRDNLHKFIIKNTNFPHNIPLAMKEAYNKMEIEYKEQYSCESGSHSLFAIIADNNVYIANNGTSLAFLSMNDGKQNMMIAGSGNVECVNINVDKVDFILFGSAGISDELNYSECFNLIWKYMNTQNVAKYDNVHSFSGGVVDHLIKTAFKKGSCENISCLLIGFDGFVEQYNNMKVNEMNLLKKKQMMISKSINKMIVLNKENVLLHSNNNKGFIHNDTIPNLNSYFTTEKKQLFKHNFLKRSFLISN